MNTEKRKKTGTRFILSALAGGLLLSVPENLTVQAEPKSFEESSSEIESFETDVQNEGEKQQDESLEEIRQPVSLTEGMILAGADEEKTQTIYRLYNPNSGEHFYTARKEEQQMLISKGWKSEANPWKAPLAGQAVYRLYNPNASDHHYTKSQQERAALIRAGWKDEGTAFFSADDCGRSVYRLYNPNAKSGSHHYTLSRNESDALEKSGWIYEGRSLFAFSPFSFQKENGQMFILDENGKELSGPVRIFDEWYELDANGVLQTGWTGTAQKEGLPGLYFHDENGRRSFGKTKIDSDWYFFDLQSGKMLRDSLMEHRNQTDYYGSDGKAVKGRIFVDGKLGQADPEAGTIDWKEYGWKNDPNRHRMFEKKKKLESRIEQWKKQGVFLESPSDPLMQETLAELGEINELLALQDYQEILKVYNPNSGEHFLTSSSAEADALARKGWKKEGRAFLAAKKLSRPVYRLYHSKKGHFYTASSAERDLLKKQGWKDEGTAFYQAPISKTPVYRLCNPNSKASAHHFTANRLEKEALIRLGWRDEGTGFEMFNLVSFVQDEQSKWQAWDENDRPLSGLVTLFSDRYYFDPNDQNAAATGARTIDWNGRKIEVLFDQRGRMVFGERKTAQGLEFYDLDSGEKIKNRFYKHAAPSKVCYYDQNGYRVYGYRTIRNRRWLFDEKTGALKPDYDSLKTMVSNYLKARVFSYEQVAFALRVPGTDITILINSKPQQSASVMKAFVMGAIVEDYDKYASRVGAGYLNSQLSVMISVSNNEAWANLVSVLGNGSYSNGLQVLRRWNQSHGYTQTQMMGLPKQNFTSAADASKLLCDIQEGKLKNSRQMKALLQTQRVPGRMLQGLPPEVRTANKPGWIDTCQNDTVLIDAPFGTYVVTMLCDQMQYSSKGLQLMADVSPMVYQWMKENMNIGKDIPR